MAAHIEHISELPLAELIKSFLLESGNNLLVMFYAYPVSQSGDGTGCSARVVAENTDSVCCYW